VLEIFYYIFTLAYEAMAHSHKWLIDHILESNIWCIGVVEALKKIIGFLDVKMLILKL
jgi:hypothetical protein